MLSFCFSSFPEFVVFVDLLRMSFVNVLNIVEFCCILLGLSGVMSLLNFAEYVRAASLLNVAEFVRCNEFAEFCCIC